MTLDSSTKACIIITTTMGKRAHQRWEAGCLRKETRGWPATYIGTERDATRCRQAKRHR